VSFRKARMQDLWLNAATFVECDFSLARLDKVEFYGCELVRCTFSGPVSDLIFHVEAYPMGGVERIKRRLGLPSRTWTCR
jgi:uncharacterized protein YjbI with pentapeptide repeats